MSFEIEFEKDGKPTKELPSYIKEGIEKLSESGYNPNAHIETPDYAKPKVEEFVTFTGLESNDFERYFENMVLKMKPGEKFAMDFKDLDKLQGAEKVLRKLKPFLTSNNIQFFLTERMRAEVLSWQRS